MDIRDREKNGLVLGIYSKDEVEDDDDVDDKAMCEERMREREGER